LHTVYRPAVFKQRRRINSQAISTQELDIDYISVALKHRDIALKVKELKKSLDIFYEYDR
jgi:hypothetical protein